MNFPLVMKYIGVMLKVEAAAMLPAIVISLCRGEFKAASALLFTFAITAAASFLPLLKRPKSRRMSVRDGFLIVSLSWLILSAFGALPFVLSGEIKSYVDAFFETVSGFTTTGATIVNDVEIMSRGLVYWRSFTHWLGGMGVLVFVLALVPKNEGVGGPIFVLRAESPGPVPDKLTPKIRDTAVALYAIYTALTLLLVVLLVLGGMSVFDSFVTAFGTAGTGGFSSMNLSLGAWDSKYLQIVVGVFMVLFGVNFSIYFSILRGRLRDVWRSDELKAYLIIIAAATLAIAFNIAGSYPGFSEALHQSFFQVASIMTTTGFSTADFDLWPAFSKAILLVLMIVGACAGSTGGGVKVVRIVGVFRMAKNAVVRKLHPNAVTPVIVDGAAMSTDVSVGILEYLGIYFILCVASILVVCFDTNDLITSISGVLACINNIGPGLGALGPTCTYSGLSAVSKLVLSADMLIGRLEIFPLLLIFTRSFWKKAA